MMEQIRTISMGQKSMGYSSIKKQGHESSIGVGHLSGRF